MLRTPPFLGPLNSGFVPDTPAAPVDALADDAIAADAAIAEAEAAEVVARAAAAAPVVDAPLAEPVAPWLPASSTRIRIVEGAVLAAICGYFAWGLVRTLAGF